MKPAVLESVIEQKNISELLTFGHQARFVPVRSDHDRHVTEPLCHQARFIAGLLPV